MRFDQPDTLISEPYNPLDWNRYAYALDNPIRFNDPSRHVPCDEEGYCYDRVRGQYCVPVRYEITPYNQLWRPGISDPSYDPKVLEQNVDELGKIGEVVASVLWEPADWATTIGHCAQGDCSGWSLLGLLPFIQSSAGRLRTIWLKVVSSQLATIQFRVKF
jgi:hypothetical protein